MAWATSTVHHRYLCVFIVVRYAAVAFDNANNQRQLGFFASSPWTCEYHAVSVDVGIWS